MRDAHFDEGHLRSVPSQRGGPFPSASPLRPSPAEQERVSAGVMPWCWAIAMVLSFCASLGFAQRAGPAGNAHPTETLDASRVVNPLDDRDRPATPVATPRQKHDFARQLDLSPLARLALMHNSRVATLDTLARDTIRTMTNRGRYQDMVATPKASGEGMNVDKLNYDPLFTYLDILADADYYVDKPIISVDFLPLRAGILAKEFPGDPSKQERWMVATRLSPLILTHQRQALATEFMANLTFERGMRQMNTAANAFINAYATLNVVPPETPHGEWLHASQHPETAAQFARLGEAWRAMDAPRVNAIAAEIGRAAPAIHAANYPPAWRAKLELLYNTGNKIVVNYTIYFLALLALLIAFGTGRAGVRRLGVALLCAGLGLHAAMFAARWVLAERIPIQNQFESMMGLSLGACLVGTVLMFARRQAIFGAAAAGVGCLMLVGATLEGIPGEEIGREAAILNTSYILFYHVNTVLFSYGLIALGFIVSVVYLLTHYLSRRAVAAPAMVHVAATGLGNVIVAVGAGGEDGGDAFDEDGAPSSTLPGRQRLLSDLDHAQMVILQLAFWILGVGILLGAWWADHSWGRWWAFDPKETWALITWIVYLVVIHVRFVAPSRALVTAWLSVLGFFTMLWTYFGVNLLLPGLHAYA